MPGRLYVCPALARWPDDARYGEQESSRSQASVDPLIGPIPHISSLPRTAFRDRHRHRALETSEIAVMIKQYVPPPSTRSVQGSTASKLLPPMVICRPVSPGQQQQRTDATAALSKTERDFCRCGRGAGPGLGCRRVGVRIAPSGPTTHGRQ